MFSSHMLLNSNYDFNVLQLQMNLTWSVAAGMTTMDRDFPQKRLLGYFQGLLILFDMIKIPYIQLPLNKTYFDRPSLLEIRLKYNTLKFLSIDYICTDVGHFSCHQPHQRCAHGIVPGFTPFLAYVEMV